MTKSKTKTIIYLLCLCLVSMVFQFVGANLTYASSNTVPFESVSLSNQNFDSSPNTTTLDSNPTGWSTLKTSSSALSGIINVNAEKVGDNYEQYGLTQGTNPGKKSSAFDDKVLMINSSNTAGVSTATLQGYESSSITFHANSYYIVTVYARALDGATGTIYLTGIEDDFSQNYINVTNNYWTEYQLYISTGSSSITSTIELWLGQKENTTSNGAVFFDQISIDKCQENYYQENLYAGKTTQAIDLEVADFSVVKNYVLGAVTNADFETGTKEGWELASDYLPASAIAEVMNLTTQADMTSYGLTYLGSNNSYNNTFGLVLSSDEAVAFGYKSSTITLPMHGIYRISVSVKTDNISGNAHIILNENNDINEFYADRDGSGAIIEDTVLDFYTPTSNTISINSTATNNFTNNYTTCSFYVYGDSRYSTSFNLELWLGSSDEPSSGTVVFDDIKVESISYEEYNSVTAGDTDVKVDISTISGTPSFTNGAFNTVINQDSSLVYPLLPSDWTRATVEDEEYSAWGVINTYTELYESIRVSQLEGYTNPGNPKRGTAITPITDTNNILMIWNKGRTYQTIESPTFTASANTTTILRFDYKTISGLENDNILDVLLVDSNGNTINLDAGLSASDWSKYEIAIKTGSAEKTFRVQLRLGTSEAQVKGVAYLDNFETTTTEETTLTNVVDYTDNGMNLYDELNENGTYTPLAYTSTLENGTNPSTGNPVAFGGIIKPDDNIFGEEGYSDKNLFIIVTNGAATYSITSNDTIALEAGKYYVFKVQIKTNLPVYSGEAGKQAYGAEFSLTGIDDQLSTIVSNDNYIEYKIYVNAVEATNVSTRFALASDTIDNIGRAYFSDFSYEEITQAAYDEAQTQSIPNSVFTQTATPTEDEPETPEPTNFNWLIIPSLIFGLAIIIAIVGATVRKVKFKKREKKEISEYNRTTTLHRDVVRVEAEKRRDARLKELDSQIEKLEQEKAELDEANKQRVAESRKAHGRQLTREDEKEFRLYASKHTKLQNAIDKLKQEKELTKTPEYLLTEMRKIRKGK